MNIADDLVKAFNDGYEKGKADAEFYLQHCGDTDDPMTNADRIRSMTDRELASFITFQVEREENTHAGERFNRWFEWLKEEAE